MTLIQFVNLLKSDLKNIENIYRGLVLTELSLPNFERNSKAVYNKSIYVDASNKSQAVKLLINLSILNEAINNGYTINENVSVDVTIDTITLDTKGTILINISKIVESGISEQELFIKNLTSYCKENKLFEREKRKYPSIIKRIALVSTTNSNTLDDILKNINHKLFTSSYKVQNSSNAIAEQINFCNTQDFDLILLYRGGHQDKSMNIYSDIPVLNAIYNSNIHVGVALGHEIDIPFVYRIADSTYSTPTNFAQVINEYNQNKLNDFQNTVDSIGNSINSIKNKIQSSFESFKWDNIDTVITNLESKLKISNGNINLNSNKLIHAFELDNETLNSNINKIADTLKHKNEVNFNYIYSNIESNHLQLISSLNENLSNCVNNINTLTDQIYFKIEQKKNRRIRLILIVSLIAALGIIGFFIFKN